MRIALFLVAVTCSVACSTGEDVFGGSTGSGAGGTGGSSSRSTSTAKSATANNASSTPASSSTGEDFCTIEDDDDDCTQCAKINCCPQLTQCSGDENCACWAKCAGDGHGFFECQDQCGPQGPTYGLLEGCLAGPCLIACT